MINYFKDLYLCKRFFIAGIIITSIFVISFSFQIVFNLAIGLLVIYIFVLLFDVHLLFYNNDVILVDRSLPNNFSLGDSNIINLEITNCTYKEFRIELIEELPIQLQIRDFKINFNLANKETKKQHYILDPKSRGEYSFGNTICYLSSKIGFIQRRIITSNSAMVKVYPSIVQMKNIELKAFSSTSIFNGVKKIRRIGHSYEFEQIKSYVNGDDYRTINWKATSRKNSLMVNHYEDEKSQQVYSVIDRGRLMNMPFNGLSLLDYSINTALAISNVSIRKSDKAGVLTFDNNSVNFIKADNKNKQLQLIIELLYRQTESTKESDFELLFTNIKNNLNGRSLLFLFTNFESSAALKRQISILRKINLQHLLVVVIFENDEIKSIAKADVANFSEMYNQAIAQKFIIEKQQMLQILTQYGIQTIYTTPSELSMSTLNKYLELKAKGLI